jgi:hypothetical protein
LRPGKRSPLHPLLRVVWWLLQQSARISKKLKLMRKMRPARGIWRRFLDFFEELPLARRPDASGATCRQSPWFAAEIKLPRIACREVRRSQLAEPPLAPKRGQHCPKKDCRRRRRRRWLSHVTTHCVAKRNRRQGRLPQRSCGQSRERHARQKIIDSRLNRLGAVTIKCVLEYGHGSQYKSGRWRPVQSLRIKMSRLSNALPLGMMLELCCNWCNSFDGHVAAQSEAVGSPWLICSRWLPERDSYEAWSWIISSHANA